MKVDFIILGAQKCGTSTLFDILAQHPSIEACRCKEPHFFSTSNNWKRDLPEYEKLFKKRNGTKYLEASTSYTFYPHRRLGIWNDLYEYNPNLKFIYMVRNPIDRIVSSYMHNYQRGYTSEPIEEIIFKTPLFIDITRYYTQVIPFVKKFGRKKVHILDLEDMKNKSEDMLRGISEFLNIDFREFQNYKGVHTNKSIGGHKVNYKFDHPKGVFKIIRHLFPGLWQLMLKHSRREFKERPTLRKAYREAIHHVLDLDINGLQRLLEKDLTAWKGARQDATPD